MSITTVHRASIEALVRLFRQKKISASARRVIRGSRFLSYDIRLKNPTQYDMAISVAEPLALALGVRSVAAYRDLGVVRFDITLPESHWQVVNYSDMTMPYQIGMLPGNKPVHFNLSDPNQMIVGVPGSGKSEGIKTILLSTLLQRSPNELRLMLIDPHKAIIEFNTPHFILPPATEKEEIAAALVALRTTLNERKGVGEAIVRANPDDYPLVMLVVDEASEPNVLGTKDFPNKENIALVQQLAKEGRKFNMRLLLGTQKPTEADLPGIMSMFPVRYVGQVTDAKMASNFSGKKEVPAHLLTGNGDFFRAKGNELERFQFALSGRDDYARLTNGVRVIDVVPTNATIASVGRPLVDIDASAIGHYLTNDKVTLKSAKSTLGFSRTMHERHREFAMLLQKKLNQLGYHVSRL